MSATLQITDYGIVREYEVAESDTATQGQALILDSDTTVDDAPADSDLAVGIALSSETAGKKVRVLMFTGAFIAMVRVGTGGATRGKKAKIAADGFTDASAHDSDGTGNESTYGTFLASESTVGSFVPMMFSGCANRGV